MKGKYRVVVQNKRIRYDFEIRRNLTVIRGDSATGKTTLIDMIREYYEDDVGSGVQLQCDKVCAVISGRSWKLQLAEISDSIVFIDEGNEFIFTDEFAAVIRSTDNYYVMVTRESLPPLPYSAEEIYGIRNSGKYGTLAQTYNQFYHLYNLDDFNHKVKPNVIITEDSNSGYQFFRHVSDNFGIFCISANGKSNIFSEVLNLISDKNSAEILIIADGAAFGAEMEKITLLMKNQKTVDLYLPESFEWLILNSGIINDSEIREILRSPDNYIDSREYFSWERFFTALLIAKSDRTYLKYSKKTLNPHYLNEKISDKILYLMKRIEIKTLSHF
ncbi:MAG: ATP-binding protein [Clostridia bacterium]|nr:ATP-binding protein [Clostridia bacterium]